MFWKYSKVLLTTSTMTIYFNILTHRETLRNENQEVFCSCICWRWSRLWMGWNYFRFQRAFSLNQPFHPASCYSQSQHLHRNTFCVTEIVATASALLSTWEAWTCWRESSKGPQTSLSNWSISSVRRGWESWGCLESRSEFINAYKYLNRGGKEDRPRVFSGVPSDRIRGNEHTLKHGTFPLNIRKHFFTVRVTKHLLVQKGCGVSILGDIQKPFGHGSGQPAWEEGLYQLTSRGSFKPQWYCGSVVSYLQTENPLRKNWKLCNYCTGIQNMGLKHSTSGLMWCVFFTQRAACVKEILS